MIPEREKERKWNNDDIKYNKKKREKINPSYPQPESNHKIMSNGHFLVVKRI
jgi:hypothetical protein